jgi:hypothetical protein
MSLPITVLQLYTPTWLKKRQLADLFECTATAFGSDAPSIEGLSFDESLAEYARFTAAQAEAALRRGDVEAVQVRLYSSARELGRRLRRQLWVTGDDEAMSATRLLYRGLEVDLRGAEDGEVEVRRCFFSGFYSSQVCEVISALDAGVAAGLSGGGELTFYQRITEGHDRCRAKLRLSPLVGSEAEEEAG